jgi:hypothetical protein
MGVNMYIYAERRIDGQWHFLKDAVKKPDESDDVVVESTYEMPHELYWTTYDALCAILADVSNEGELEAKYDSVTSRRGAPEDLSPELKAFYTESIYNQDPSTIISWCTLQELATFNWRKIRKHYATVDERVIHLFHPERGYPLKEWPQGIERGYSPTAQAYANVSWTETYADAAKPDFMKLLDSMRETYGPTDDVRFVMWFLY